MSKGTLTFKLPEEAEEFRQASDGIKWQWMVQQLDHRLRDCLKYDDKLTTQERTSYELARSFIQRGIEENNLKLWNES